VNESLQRYGDMRSTQVKNTLYLFSRRHDLWGALSRKLQSSPSVALFLDYDGTITPLRSKPTAAVLEPETAGLLRVMTKLPGVHVSIVTGRSMEVIRKLVRVRNLGIAASHGFHIVQDGTEWIHPEVGRFSGKLTRLQSKLERSLGEIPNVILERKQGTLTVHYRNVPSRSAGTLKSITAASVRTIDPKFQIMRGKKILEIRPPIPWGKGRAVMKMVNGRGSRWRPLTIFVGDDTTDEDAFRSLRTKGITVRVGRSRSTRAKYYVKNIEDVHRLLRFIIAIRANRKHESHHSRVK